MLPFTSVLICWPFRIESYLVNTTYWIIWHRSLWSMKPFCDCLSFAYLQLSTIQVKSSEIYIGLSWMVMHFGLWFVIPNIRRSLLESDQIYSAVFPAEASCFAVGWLCAGFTLFYIAHVCLQKPSKCPFSAGGHSSRRAKWLRLAQARWCNAFLVGHTEEVDAA